jgi:hypothetical protein
VAPRPPKVLFENDSTAAPPASMPRFSSGLKCPPAGSSNSLVSSSSSSTVAALRHELEQVQRAFYGNVATPQSETPATRLSLLEDQQRVLTRRTHDALRDTETAQRICKQSVAAAEPLAKLIDADRSVLVGLLARAFALADTTRSWEAAETAMRLFRRFEMRVTRALLLDPSISNCISATACGVPFIASFVEMELFLTSAAHFGSVAYCNWSLIKRKLFIDDSYFDLVEQTTVLGRCSLDGVRQQTREMGVESADCLAAMADRLALVEEVAALPESHFSLEALLAMAAARSFRVAPLSARRTLLE